jgi:rhodanese-related sulfurtransferase
LFATLVNNIDKVQIRMFSKTLREALLIIAVASVVGFSYTAATHRGLFALAQPHDSTHPPQFILLDEAVQLFHSDSATFVDARHAYDFGLGHIKGAINVPLNELTLAPLGGISKDRVLVAYCDGQECNSSLNLALKLDSLGYSNVKIFFGGWREWTNNNQPTD